MRLSRAVAFVVLALAVAAGSTTARPIKPRWQTLPIPPVMPKADAQGSVDVKGANIFYAVYGKGDPVVLLHGGLGNSAHFAFQLPALVDKFQVIAIDSRGHGRSTRGKAAITYDQMATDVVAVLDKLAIRRASVVGWSDGGEIALKLGIAYPDRVDRLFVFAANYDANGSKPRTGPSPTFAAYSAKCRSDFERLARTGSAYSALVDALLPLWRGPTGITRDQLHGIKAPVMMADGDHDEVIMMSQIEEMATLIPNAQLKVFDDASHFALWQDPDAFNRTLVGFLTAHAAPPAAGSAAIAGSAVPASIPASGPAPGPVPSPASGPASIPAAGPASGPASIRASIPATGPAAGPASGRASIPATGPAAGPASIPASGPASIPAAGSRRVK